MEQEESEDSFCQICYRVCGRRKDGGETGWCGQNKSQIIGEEKKSGRLDGAAETSKEHAE